MGRAALVLIASTAACSMAIGAERLRFWNLTAATITKLYLAPAGTGDWGGDQCRNDPDGSVDPDERLTLTGAAPGRYDVKLVDKNGRTCIVRGVELKGDQRYAFSLEERDLTACDR
jgi:hypothetical protein